MNLLNLILQAAVGRHRLSTATGAMLCAFVLLSIRIIQPSQEIALGLVAAAIIALLGGRGYGEAATRARRKSDVASSEPAKHAQDTSGAANPATSRGDATPLDHRSGAVLANASLVLAVVSVSALNIAGGLMAAQHHAAANRTLFAAGCLFAAALCALSCHILRVRAANMHRANFDHGELP